MYSHEAAITIVGVDVTKTFSLSCTWQLPVNIAVVFNPKTEDLFLAVTLSL
ncbi:MAG: hypothetical protein PF489_07225 [Salinivirgaceae bacterium]|nr:hypothetical protein [Salinivirgaceae bacterium]